MRLRVVDRKGKEVINIKIDITEKMYIVAPDIINDRFEYLRGKLFNIRKKHLKTYLNNTDQAKDIEHDLFNEFFDVLTEEMHTIYEREGIMYYTM